MTITEAGENDAQVSAPAQGVLAVASPPRQQGGGGDVVAMQTESATCTVVSRGISAIVVSRDKRFVKPY